MKQNLDISDPIGIGTPENVQYARGNEAMFAGFGFHQTQYHNKNKELVLVYIINMCSYNATVEPFVGV
jgi:hypothetical protein